MSRRGAFPLGERAEHFIAGSTGVSGTTLCMPCENCVSRIYPERVAEGFVHFMSPGLSGGMLPTYESWSAILDYLHDHTGE